MSILVWIEQNNGSAISNCWEVLGKAKELCRTVCAVVIGAETGAVAAEAQKHGVSTVYTISNPALANYRLSAYASALSVGLAKEGFNILTVYPGPTKTEHARRYSPDNSKEEQRMDPEELAERIYKAVKARKRFLIPGMKNWGMAIAAKWFPGRAEEVMKREVFIKLAAKRRK